MSAIAQKIICSTNWRDCNFIETNRSLISTFSLGQVGTSTEDFVTQGGIALAEVVIYVPGFPDGIGSPSNDSFPNPGIAL